MYSDISLHVSLASRFSKVDSQFRRKFFAGTRIGHVLSAIALSAFAGSGWAADTTPPSIPTGLKAVKTAQTAVKLSWSPAWDNVRVAGYKVYINNAMYTQTTGNSYQLVGLKPGTTYKYRVAAYDAAKNQSSWTGTPVSYTAPTTASTPTAVAPSGSTTFNCSFANAARECGFGEQAKAAGRAILTSVARDGGTAVMLRTFPGDSYVAGSGSAERNDLALSQGSTGCSQGVTQWWSHSIRFPTEYVIPPSGSVWHWGAVFDFHHTGSTGQANLQIVSLPTGLAFWVAGGSKVVNGPGDPGHHSAPIGPIVKNTWYDFVYNVKWSSGTDGFVKGWVNGVLKLNYKGPTLYSGQGCYMKLANYHSAHGKSVSVIHDRIKRGTSASAVSSRALQ